MYILYIPTHNIHVHIATLYICLTSMFVFVFMFLVFAFLPVLVFHPTFLVLTWVRAQRTFTGGPRQGRFWAGGPISRPLVASRR